MRNWSSLQERFEERARKRRERATEAYRDIQRRGFRVTWPLYGVNQYCRIHDDRLGSTWSGVATNKEDAVILAYQAAAAENFGEPINQTGNAAALQNSIP